MTLKNESDDTSCFENEKPVIEKNSTRIEIILGCMYSGKTTELIRRTNRYKAIGKQVLIINHMIDERTDSNSIQTHSNGQTSNKENAVKISELLKIFEIAMFDECDIIGIDEAQFFPDLLEFVKKVETYNKILIIAGLDGDYKREPIGQILQCIPFCDEVTKLNAMDMIDKDGSPAIFSKRIVGGNNQILVGANESYIAVSRKNFLS